MSAMRPLCEGLIAKAAKAAKAAKGLGLAR